jgi:hypothetical protein
VFLLSEVCAVTGVARAKFGSQYRPAWPAKTSEARLEVALSGKKSSRLPYVNFDGGFHRILILPPRGGRDCVGSEDARVSAEWGSRTTRRAASEKTLRSGRGTGGGGRVGGGGACTSSSPAVVPAATSSWLPALLLGRGSSSSVTAVDLVKLPAVRNPDVRSSGCE